MNKSESRHNKIKTQTARPGVIMKKILSAFVFLANSMLFLSAILFSCMGILFAKLSGGFEWLSCWLETASDALDEWEEPQGK